MFTSDGKMSSALSRGADTNRFLFRVNDHLMGNPVAVQEKGWTDLQTGFETIDQLSMLTQSETDNATNGREQTSFAGHLGLIVRKARPVDLLDMTRKLTQTNEITVGICCFLPAGLIKNTIKKLVGVIIPIVSYL